MNRAGAGSDFLYQYDPDTSRFAFLGIYLIGIQCNPYPNGVSYHKPSKTLHVTWTNRHFIDYDGATDEDSTTHKAQAGPNGPENNEGLYHTYSTDGGKTWVSCSGQPIAALSTDNGRYAGLDARDTRLLVKNIPRNSGIMN